MPREMPSLPSPFEIGGSRQGEQVDPELVSLPDPPRVRQWLAMLVLVAGTVAAVAMAVLLRRDAAYAFASATPSGVVDLRTATQEALAAHDNALIRAEGLLGAAGGIRYERPLREDTFRALPIAGRTEGDGVWVEVRVRSGQESGRWEPPRAFVGRLVRFDEVGPRHRGIARAIEETTRMRVGASAFLLIDGEEPTQERWAVLLWAMFLGFAAWNAVVLARLARPVK
ncbi:MAG: hypothetical protein ABSF69_05640 [Polyangiaceae bacterium]